LSKCGVTTLEASDLIEIYRKMLKIRLFEEEVVKLFSRGQIPGFLHTYIGEEAVAVGVMSSLRKDDYVTSTHRGHGHCIAKGADINRMMAELFGKATGYCKGKGGSMHIADFELNMLGANGIVGAGLPLACGAGLSIRMRKTDQVAAAFFGDGASNEGTFHEALNLAAVWSLPVLFVCENNQYAVSYAIQRATLVKNLAERASAYGIPGATVDGCDVMSVYEAASQAVDRARKGKGPTLLECKTFRWRGHYEGDPQKYRPKAEVAALTEKCPIRMFEDKLYTMNVLTKDTAEEERRQIRKQIEEAVKFAEDSPLPEPESAAMDVFA
jgi:pyruvate dehydrogenase E1 component alpha subunit